MLFSLHHCSFSVTGGWILPCQCVCLDTRKRQALRFEVSVKFSALAPLTCLGRPGRLSRLSLQSLQSTCKIIVKHMPLPRFPRTSKETRLAIAEKEEGTVVAISAISVSKSCGCYAATFFLWLQDFRRLLFSSLLLCFVLLVRACDQPIYIYIRYKISMCICVDFVGFHTCCHDVFPS